MENYVDVFIIPVPKSKLKAYRKLAELSAKVWREHGALDYVEVEADDAPMGKLTSFPQSVDLKPGETVIVALITHTSRADRDEVNKKAMQDPRMAGMDPKTFPFDGKRMIFGGFKPFVGGTAEASGAAARKKAVARPLKVQPYLFFGGRCEEAITFYKKVLGAEVLMLMRFRENPDKPGPGEIAPALDDKIMHASLRIGETEVMMSDGMSLRKPEFKGVSLSLNVPSVAEANRLFKALGQGGKVAMPIGKTFFSPRFGVVDDKFGVSWMVVVDP